MKKEVQQERERTRKSYTHGIRTQKMMSFRLDDDNAEWLSQQPNKGRYINDLIKTDRGRKQKK